MCRYIGSFFLCFWLKIVHICVPRSVFTLLNHFLSSGCLCLSWQCWTRCWQMAVLICSLSRRSKLLEVSLVYFPLGNRALKSCPGCCWVGAQGSKCESVLPCFNFPEVGQTALKGFDKILDSPIHVEVCYLFVVWQPGHESNAVCMFHLAFLDQYQICSFIFQLGESLLVGVQALLSWEP